MYTKDIEGQIVFYYPHKTLFENVQHQSAFMCKNIISKEGDDLSERYAITDDEEPMFVLCLGETLPDVYDVMKVITHGIAPAFYSEIPGAEFLALDEALASDATLGIETSEKYVVVRVDDNEAYNPNNLRIVDSALRSGIEQGALANFYTRVIHPDLTKLATSAFAGQLQVLAQRIIPLRKKTRFF